MTEVAGNIKDAFRIGDGIARNIDLGAVYGFGSVYFLNHYLKLTDAVDIEALRDDWINTGNDLRHVLEGYGRREKS